MPTQRLFPLSSALPALALGLFSGRVLGEAWALLRTPLAWPAAVAVTLATTVAALWLLRGVSLRRAWPALLLLLYVVYPDADPRAAVLVAGVAAVAWLLIPREYGRRITSFARVAVPVALTLGFFVLYVATLAPDVLPADSGELQVVAANLGVAHPPGFPLYTLLAHLMTRLPLPGPAYAVNLFAAVTSTATLLLVYACTWALTRRVAAAAAAVLVLGTATTFWSQATTANVRSLTALFAALMLYALIRFYQATGESNEKTADRFLLLFALGLGLGITHHASLAFMGVVFLLFVVWVDASLLRAPRRWRRPLLAALLGLLPLLYLPLRATADVRGARPGLATAEGFLNHVLARGFRGDFFYFVTPEALGERLRVMGNVLLFQFSPWLLLGMALGLLLLLWRDRKPALLLGGSFALHALVTATYRAPQTVEYMLPAYVPLVLLLGYGIGALFARPRRPLTSAVAPGVAALLLVAALQQGANHAPSYRALHLSRDARDTVAPLLAQAPPQSTILAHWHWATPLWYLQEVEGLRPDVSVRFVFPEGEPYAETWSRRVAAAWADGRSVIATYYDPATFGALPPPEPLHEAFLFRQEPRTTLPETFTPLDAVFGDRVAVLGYRLDRAAVAAGDEAVLEVAWQPAERCRAAPEACPAPPTLFAHLVGNDGRIYAQEDAAAQPQPEGISVTQFRLTPRPGAAPGDYAVLLGAYDAAPLPNAAGEARTPVATLAVTARQRPPATRHPLARTIVGEEPLRLVGFDWDTTLAERPRLYLHWQTAAGYQTEVRDGAAGALPAYVGPWGVADDDWSAVTARPRGVYVPFGEGIVWTGETLSEQRLPQPGEALTLRQRFLSSAPLLRDYTVSVRLIGLAPDGVRWAWWDLDDSIPAMGAIPTLKWIDGSVVASPHFVTVAADAPPGQALTGALTLYDAFTTRPLPILDERITADFAWAPLGETAVAR